MVKSIPQVAYEDKEFKLIDEEKKQHGGNWHDFILDIVRFYKTKKEVLKDGKNNN